MASNTFFLIVLALCAAAACSQAPSSSVTISGQLCCTPTGNCPGQPVAGADVQFYSGGHVVAQNTTNIEGDITINVHYANVSNGTLIVDLPIDGDCSVLSSASGYLMAHVELDGYYSTLQISAWSRS